MPTHHLFPVRHHGPGSARALVGALDRLRPDVVLVEGPPEADALVSLVAREDLVPPVALLVYAKGDPTRSARYPFAAFSPEWQALRWAVGRDVPVRFMDLPVAFRFREESGPPLDVGAEEGNPLQLLARVAGYADPAEWWEHEVELRHDGIGLFDAVTEVMTALRAAEADRFGIRVALPADGPPTPADLWLARREAYMRKVLREALRTHERVAVVCGAWHAPALADLGGAGVDRQLLKGLRRAPVRATWIPWTHSRLSLDSGYGAGITCPGWYAEVWAGTEDLASRWLTRVARLLREEGIGASTADVISAVRLAESLASLRDLPRPGLAELREAAASVLGAGAPTVLELVRERLEVGGVIGRVPDDIPAVPLQQDVRAKRRRLRLKQSAEPRELDLDLRKDTHRERSHLLHQLSAIGLPWGRPRSHPGEDLGTFHERWTLQWDPEMEVRLVEASVWGSTTEEAAGAALRGRAEETVHLPDLTLLLDQALLAALPPVVSAILARVARQAAIAADIGHLMEALPPLARVARYGDVRQTPVEQLRTVVDALFERIAVGIPAACRSLAEDAAAVMAKRLTAVDEALGLLDRPDLLETWRSVLRRLAEEGELPGILRGRACRLLVERGWEGENALVTHARLALSRAVPPARAAAWLEGLVRGSGLLLLHLDGLWDALDHWLMGLDEATFVAFLPILRRAFSEFEPAERRAMGQRVRGLAEVTRGRDGAPPVDPERAARVLPVLRQILVSSRPPPDRC